MKSLYFILASIDFFPLPNMSSAQDQSEHDRGSVSIEMAEIRNIQNQNRGRDIEQQGLNEEEENQVFKLLCCGLCLLIGFVIFWDFYLYLANNKKGDNIKYE